MPTAVRAIRGATTVDVDTPDQLNLRVPELLREIFEQNGIQNEDVVSIIFTATSDIKSAFPATAARLTGLEDIPLFGAQELTVDKMLPLCVRVLVHVNTELERKDVTHVYLHEARRLRVDLVK